MKKKSLLYIVFIMTAVAYDSMQQKAAFILIYFNIVSPFSQDEVREDRPQTSDMEDDEEEEESEGISFRQFSINLILLINTIFS